MHHSCQHITSDGLSLVSHPLPDNSLYIFVNPFWLGLPKSYNNYAQIWSNKALSKLLYIWPHVKRKEEKRWSEKVSVYFLAELPDPFNQLQSVLSASSFTSREVPSVRKGHHSGCLFNAEESWWHNWWPASSSTMLSEPLVQWVAGSHY